MNISKSMAILGLVGAFLVVWLSDSMFGWDVGFGSFR